MMILTYQEFKNKNNERYIDYDGAYGCQCLAGT